MSAILAALLVTTAGCNNGSKLAESQQTKTVFVTPTVTQTVTVTAPATGQPPPSTRPPTKRPPTKGPPSSRPPTSPPTGSGTASSPLGLGTFHRLGSDYRATVVSVNPNANQVIAATNDFNDPPKGRYVLAWLNVEYIGTDQGSPWIDLRVKYAGTDARLYDSDQCGAVVPVDAFRQPDLSSGGHARFQVCFDLPVTAIAGGTISVEETFAFDDTSAYWKSR